MKRFKQHLEEAKLKKGQTVNIKRKFADSDEEAKTDYVVIELRGPRVLIAPKEWPKGQIPPQEAVGTHMVEACWSNYKQVGMKKKGDKMVPNCVPEEAEIQEGSETWEAGYKRRVVKTTKPEHKEKGFNWRIKGKDKAHLTIKLYKEKPSQEEFNKQMKRVAGHEFG